MVFELHRIPCQQQHINGSSDKDGSLEMMILNKSFFLERLQRILFPSGKGKIFLVLFLF